MKGSSNNFRKINEMKKRTAMSFAAALTAVCASAAPTVTDVVAKQRYPWNGLVDITCKVSGIDRRVAGLKFAITVMMPNSGGACDISHFGVMRKWTSSINKKVYANGDYWLVWDASADLGHVLCSNMVIRVTADHNKVQLWEGGPYWAETNIGAEEPWNGGDHFWWGDTVGSSNGSSFEREDVPTYNKGYSTLLNEGWITAEGVLAPEHDAAQVQWGGGWRMPTKQELSDLVSKCYWTWTTNNGAVGYIVKGGGRNASASIFLPAAGIGGVSYADSYGLYMSSVPNSEYVGNSWNLYLHSSFHLIGYYYYRYRGQSIRPVKGLSTVVNSPAGLAGDSAPFLLDTTTTSTLSLTDSDSLSISWDASWIGGDANATVVIADNGAEVKRATGAGEFIYAPTSAGRHELTYTTYIGGVAQDEVYTATFNVDAYIPLVMCCEWGEETPSLASQDFMITTNGVDFQMITLSGSEGWKKTMSMKTCDDVCCDLNAITVQGVESRIEKAGCRRFGEMSINSMILTQSGWERLGSVSLPTMISTTDGWRQLARVSINDYVIVQAESYGLFFKITNRIKLDEETKLEDAFDGLPVTIEPDGECGWAVTLTNDVNSANLPIELLDNLGPVTIDLNGHDLMGANGKDGGRGTTALPGGDGKPAIRIVPGEGDGEPTVLTIVTIGGDAIVKGGAGGVGNPGGNGAPAIKVAEGAQDGVLANIGSGVTVQGGDGGASDTGDGGNGGAGVEGNVGENNGTISGGAGGMSENGSDGVPGEDVTGIVGMPAEHTLPAGVYFNKTLAELGYDVPTDGTVYSVTAYGLPAGLQLKYNAAVTKKVKGKTVVVKKAKTEWWIEGVPTAALDFFTNPPYLVITTNGVAETYALPVEVAAQKVTVLDDLALGQPMNTNGWFVGVGAGWTVSGLPTGLKYATKKVTKKSGKKTVTVAEAYAVYGKTTKAGLFTITAKKKKGAFYETMKYRVLVRPAAVDAARFGEEMSNITNITTMAYVPVEWYLTGGGRGATALPAVAAVGGKVAKVTGLPSGVKLVGQTIVGTPTKPGTYVVTFTKNVTTGTGKKKKTVAKTAQILWKVEPNDVEVSLGFNEVGGVVESGVVGLNYGDLLAFSATSNATVSASGLPAGIKLVRLEDGGGRGATALPGEAAWGFEGFTAKAGTYLVTVKATLNGKTVTQRLALKVEGLPTWAKGTFNGCVWGTGNGEGGTGGTNGLATVTVSAAGKISGKFQELGTNWTFSAASYTAVVSGTRDAYPYQEFICSNVVAKYAYKVKSGTKTATKYVTRTFTLAVAEAVTQDACPCRGVATMTEDGGSSIEAWQNLWGRADYKALGKRIFTTKSGKKTLNYRVFTFEGGGRGATALPDDGHAGRVPLPEGTTLSLKVTTAGAVTATLSYDTGKTKRDPKTKKTVKVVYKATCSTVVVPLVEADAEPFAGEVPLYFAPSAANGFDGFAGSVVVP